MYELANIKAYKASKSSTQLIIEINDSDIPRLIKDKHMRQLEVRFNDGRHISNEQRKKAYATIGDIARWTGYLPEEAKEQLKCLYVAQTGERYISLGSCTMDEAREFINVILDFALKNGIPLTDFGADRTDDISKYLYSCLIHHRCCKCGRNGQIRVLNDMSAICLCDNCNDEMELKGILQFTKANKVYGIEIKEEDLLKIEGVNNS